MIDGSASRPIIPELARAAAAIVKVSEEGKPVVSVQAAVWNELPQTSASSENLGLALLSMVAQAQVQPWCDNMGAIRLASKPVAAQLHHAQRFAGYRKFAHTSDRHHFLALPQHTKAHRSLEEIDQLAGRDKKVALGNHFADARAKEALLSHPQPSQGQVRQMEHDVEFTFVAAKLAASVLKVFPVPERRERVQGYARLRVKHTTWHTWNETATG